MDQLQRPLYADASQALLVVLQALDAGGKDGRGQAHFQRHEPTRRDLCQFLESPEDIMDFSTAPLVPGTQYRVAPRSVMALLVRTDALWLDGRG